MKYSEIWYGALLTSQEMVDLLNKCHKKGGEGGEGGGPGDCDRDDCDRTYFTCEDLEKMDRALRVRHTKALVPKFISVECNKDLCCYPKNQETRYLVGNRIDPTQGAEHVKCIFPLRLKRKTNVKRWLEDTGFKGEFLFVNQHCWCT